MRQTKVHSVYLICKLIAKVYAQGGYPTKLLGIQKTEDPNVFPDKFIGGSNSSKRNI